MIRPGPSISKICGEVENPGTYNPRVPQITALIMALIIERPMCVECIAARAQTAPDTIKGYIDRMRASIAIQDSSGRCRTCGREGVSVYWLPSHPDDLPPD